MESEAASTESSAHPSETVTSDDDDDDDDDDDICTDESDDEPCDETVEIPVLVPESRPAKKSLETQMMSASSDSGLELLGASASSTGGLQVACPSSCSGFQEEKGIQSNLVFILCL